MSLGNSPQRSEASPRTVTPSSVPAPATGPAERTCTSAPEHSPGEQFSRLTLPRRSEGAERAASAASPESSSTTAPAPAEKKAPRDILKQLGENITQATKWCGEKIGQLASVRSADDLVRWIGETSREASRGIAAAAEELMETFRAVRDAGVELQAAHDGHQPQSGFSDLMTEISREQTDERALEAAREAAPRPFTTGIFEQRPEATAGTPAEREAVKSAATVNPTMLDQATLAELRLARLFNHLPSPNSGEVERALADADRASHGVPWLRGGGSASGHPELVMNDLPYELAAAAVALRYNSHDWRQNVPIGALIDTYNAGRYLPLRRMTDSLFEAFFRAGTGQA